MNAAPGQAAKKPYQKPSLKVYGDIHALTGTAGKHAFTSDGMIGKFTIFKTH